MDKTQLFDGVIDARTNAALLQELLYESEFRYGEKDHPNAPVTGMVLDLPEHLCNFFVPVAVTAIPSLKNKTLQRAYANLFSPSERPMFHADGPVTTCLFYITTTVSADEGGETQFLLPDGNIFGVMPKPGRLAVFDGMAQHRATSFRTKPRITVALKFFTHGETP